MASPRHVWIGQSVQSDKHRDLTEHSLLFYDTALVGLEPAALQADLGHTVEIRPGLRDCSAGHRFAADFRRTAGDPNLRFELWAVREEDY
jgi:hypothetical protein